MSTTTFLEFEYVWEWTRTQMELFNYIRNSGYERESPFVNDVKFHPVLKARKSFASGILDAFTSSSSSNSEKQAPNVRGYRRLR